MEAAIGVSESARGERILWRLHNERRCIVAFVRVVDHGAELRVHLDGELLTASLFREGKDSIELASMAARTRATLERHGWKSEPAR